MPITVEHVDFIAIPTQDTERSLAFYRDTLGLPFEREQPGGFEVQAGQVTLGIGSPEERGFAFTPSTSPFAIRVPDVEEARKTLEAAGVAFHGETLDTGVCHMAFFRDPDGNALMLHRRYAPLS
jgi:predicted enzyme related to lactoylglutathione lyase